MYKEKKKGGGGNGHGQGCKRSVKINTLPPHSIKKKQKEKPCVGGVPHERQKNYRHMIKRD